MSSQVQELKPGEYEIVVSKTLATGGEQFQVRAVVTDSTQFEEARKKMYADFITPRMKEAQAEVVEYQREMQRIADEAERAEA